jgi:hypothetical protein
MNVAIYHTDSTPHIAKALHDGIMSCGDSATINPPQDSLHSYNTLAFFGMSTDHIQLYNKFRNENKPVIIVDLGFLGTRKGPDGYFKVSVNYWHPTKYFQHKKHDSVRFDRLHIKTKPLRKGGKHILLAGIGHKSAVLYNMKHQSWDKHAASELMKHTTMPIIYRAKPNNAKSYEKIKGTKWSDPDIQLTKLLNETWAIVTHHSNAAIDGIINGVPCFVNDGVSLMVGLNDLSKIKSPKIITQNEQMQFLCDLSYTQWTINEISSGECWTHLKSEKLIG